MTIKDTDSPAKRRKLNADQPQEALEAIEHHNQGSIYKGLDRSISPPLSRRRSPATPRYKLKPNRGIEDVPKEALTSTALELDAHQDRGKERERIGKRSTKYVPSPFQLTHIQDLRSHQNVDAVQLKDILGNPMIKECWNFNYLFDLSFVMKQFDEDVRDLVKVKIIHGFWRNDDDRRNALLEEAERYPNIELHHAYIPDPFGTHHSKMLVLFRHDDHAQVVIHTANMIPRDWGNMSQAVWCSPMLPLRPSDQKVDTSTISNNTSHPIGSGERFKIDILRYFKAYGKRLAKMTTQLVDYDFSAIKAAFIGSAPSRQKPAEANPSEQTSFGWLGLQEVLSTVPTTTKLKPTSPPHIVLQVSSIATLGAAPTWLTQFQSVLARSTSYEPLAPNPSTKTSKAMSFLAKNETSSGQEANVQRPEFNLIFPTPDEIRTSLDGYASGGSIHTKLQSQQQQKQLEYLHPLFCHWKGLSTSSTSSQAHPQRHALRGPAAPHIKTYMRFTSTTHETIDWAMLTSANLSKQAWGDVVNKKNEIWVQSWEAGVVVWPALFSEPDNIGDTVMVPVFGKDMPDPKDVPETSLALATEHIKVVGIRMPYDLPLTSYAEGERPWCATMSYSEPDWKGLAWGGY